MKNLVVLALVNMQERKEEGQYERTEDNAWQFKCENSTENGQKHQKLIHFGALPYKIRA